MTGRLRPLVRYAAPIPWMNVVGEWVGRTPSGRSVPRGEMAPPYTMTSLDTALTASYVFARSAR
jgi:hypothetical protein